MGSSLCLLTSNLFRASDHTYGTWRGYSFLSIKTCFIRRSVVSRSENQLATHDGECQPYKNFEPCPLSRATICLEHLHQVILRRPFAYGSSTHRLEVSISRPLPLCTARRFCGTKTSHETAHDLIRVRPHRSDAQRRLCWLF
jgi:hypothetical protein